MDVLVITYESDESETLAVVARNNSMTSMEQARIWAKEHHPELPVSCIYGEPFTVYD